ncbi:MAG: tyrosine-type recombinase/integrase [Oscillospiraceae bacterium]
MNTLTAERIAAFEQHLKGEERSAGTVEKYLRDVRQFAVWLDGGAVTKDAVAGWKEYLHAEGYGPTTINGKLAALNALLRLMGWEDCRVKPLRLQKRMFRDSGKELTRQEYGHLIETARGQGKARLALLMETICSTGIRVSEVQYVTVEAAQAGKAEISLKGKIRTILLPGKLCRKLLKYAKKEKIASGEIFLTRSGNSLSRKQIWAEMKALCQAAGVEPAKVFPHNLRHLFATVFYQACKDIAKLADVLGHSSIETTRIYLRTAGAEHARQLERLGLIC